MTTHRLSTIVIVAAISAALGLWSESLAQRSGLISKDECNEFTSCRPWEIKAGPFCARGNKIGLRFMLDLADEERYLEPEAWGGTQRCGVNTGPNTSVYWTYAFCPKVDELQAFTLNHSGRLAGMYRNTTSDPYTFSNSQRRYVRVYGLGTKNDVEFPARRESAGAAVAVDVCPGKASDTAVVPLFILNISMNNGILQYYADYPQPGGTGFAPTCFKDTQNNDVCQLDASLPCIGDEGNKNCAICYGTPDTLINATTSIWTSYYGTDRSGRQMRSGSNSPLNFRYASGGGMYTSLSKSLNNVEEGSFSDPTLDDPGTASRAFLNQNADHVIEDNDDLSTEQTGTGNRLQAKIAEFKRKLGLGV